jgi:hypothetical protein
MPTRHRWTGSSITWSAAALAAACGGSRPAPTPAAPAAAAPAAAAPAAAGDAHAAFGPLEVGADYASYHKLTKFAHPSPTHGDRFAEIYVNEVGRAAYTSDAPLPVGTVIVKATWERDGDRASTTPGPLFVMQKRAAGYNPDHEDWYYAIHWAEPTAAMRAKFGGPFYWRSPSPRVDYCWKCHDNFDREVGLPPRDARAWDAAVAPR